MTLTMPPTTVTDGNRPDINDATPNTELDLSETENLDTLRAANAAIRLLSLKTTAPFEGVILHPDRDPSLVKRLAEIEETAYTDSGYGEKAEGEALVARHYRGLLEENVQPITYLGIQDTSQEGQEGLAFFMSIFQNKDRLIFPECKEALLEAITDGIIDPQTPLLVISKIARDPQFIQELADLNDPHLTLLAMTIFNLCVQSEHGILIETQAQPDTQRLLQPGIIRRHFRDYKVLHPEGLYTERGRLVQTPQDPEKMLLYFPHKRRRDLLAMARGR